MLTTGCECERHGWCERHQCHKSRHLHRMCQRSSRLFQTWEDGLGPGQHSLLQSTAIIAAKPCLHLRAEVRQEVCTTCKGTTQVKVFECDLHDECTIGRQLPCISCCTRCKDYDSATQ